MERCYRDPRFAGNASFPRLARIAQLHAAPELPGVLAVAEAYDFAAFKTVVDVSGGHGVLLSTILQAYAGVNGIVFDSPHVVVRAEDAIRKAGLPGRCRAVGGDFFESVPAGGD